ncbi:S41 family peptidase [Clostridiaceae bacterium M8S5]|nr:S41 family peptidase [Clostridiaceae bacterium M8S5]
MRKILCIITIGILLAIAGCNKVEEDKKSNLSVQNVTEEETFSVKEIKKDIYELRLAYDTMHLSKRDKKIREDFFRRYDEIVSSINRPMTKHEIRFMLMKYVATLDDGHSWVEIENEWYLPMNLRLIGEGLAVLNDNDDGLNKGDIVLEINGVDIDEILDKLKKIISGETIHGKKYKMSYYVTAKNVLKYLEVVNDENDSALIKVKTPKNEIKSCTVKFVKINNSKGEKTKEYFHKGFKEFDSAVFVYKRCRDNDEHKEAIKSFFEYVYDNNISNIFIDLRDNPGGHTSIAEEFFKYIDIDKFYYLYNTKKTIEHYNDKLYDGEIYVVTSNGTYSAAPLIAYMLKINKEAKIIGEPTGGGNVVYGRPRYVTLPITQINYSVSTFITHFSNRDVKYTLEPDIYMPLTVSDIVQGVDPLEEWIKGMKK